MTLLVHATAAWSRVGERGTDVHGLSQDHQGPFIGHLGDVEPEEGGGGLGDAEYVSWREHDIILHAAPRDRGGIVAIWQAAPEIEPAARDDPWRNTQRRELLYRRCPRSREAQT